MSCYRIGPKQSISGTTNAGANTGLTAFITGTMGAKLVVLKVSVAGAANFTSLTARPLWLSTGTMAANGGAVHEGGGGLVVTGPVAATQALPTTAANSQYATITPAVGAAIMCPGIGFAANISASVSLLLDCWVIHEMDLPVASPDVNNLATAMPS